MSLSDAPLRRTNRLQSQVSEDDMKAWLEPYISDDAALSDTDQHDSVLWYAGRVKHEPTDDCNLPGTYRVRPGTLAEAVRAIAAGYTEDLGQEDGVRRSDRSYNSDSTQRPAIRGWPDENELTLAEYGNDQSWLTYRWDGDAPEPESLETSR